MKQTIKNLPAILLILLYVYAAMSKWLAPEDFRGQLYNQPFAHAFAGLLFFALPATELVAAWLLASERFYKTGLYLSFGMLVSFTGYIVLIKLHFYSRVPCSCGGVISHLSWTGHLIFNVCFIALNAWALYQELRGKPKTFEQSRHHLFT